jgi:hypothetical protein
VEVVAVVVQLAQVLEIQEELLHLEVFLQLAGSVVQPQETQGDGVQAPQALAQAVMLMQQVVQHPHTFRVMPH